jgi:hypothetical protein
LLLQNKLFRDEITLEHLIIEQLYEELKGQYQFSKHAISIIIGFVLSRLGILMTEDEYEESSGDKKNSWREYLKNYVNYKIEVKSVVDSNDIVFEGKPLLEEKMKPLSSEMLSFLYSTFREDRNKA